MAVAKAAKPTRGAGAAKPVAKKPVAKKPVKTMATKPVAKKPVATKTVATKTVAKKPVAKKPVAKKPAPNKSVGNKPAPKKAAANKAAAKKPIKAVATKPAKTAKPINTSKATKQPTPSTVTKATRAKAAAPGRMRAPIAPIDTIRTPAKADDLKARLGRISGVIAQLRGHKRTMERTFFDVGELLTEVNDARLFEVKGYGSLESFLDRETDLGSNAGMRALRATTIFQRDAAQAAGFARISAALRALDGEHDAPSVGDRHSAGSLPPHKL